MGIVRRILAKGETIKIDTEDGKVDLEIKPLRNKELMEILELFEKKKNREGLNKLIFLTLKKIDAEVTMDDVQHLPIPVFIDIVKAILKVNKLEEMLEVGVKKGIPDTEKILNKLSSIESSKEKMNSLNQETE